MRGHELLEVEVGELLVLLQVQQARELAVSLDDATVAGVLELVGANVGVDLLSDLSAGHLSTLGLAKERGEGVADLGGLDEATGLAVARGRAGTLAASLLGLLNLARGTLLKLTHLSLDGGKSGADLLDVGKELGEIGVESVVLGDCVLSLDGGSLLGLGDLLGWGGRLLSGGRLLGGCCLLGWLSALGILHCSGHLIH